MNIYESSKIFFIILKVLGLAPFSFDGKTRRFTLKCLNILLFVASIIFWSILSYSEILLAMKKNETGSKSKLLDGLWTHAYSIQPFLAMCATAFNCLKMKNVEGFLASIYKFDKSFSRLGWRHETKYLKTFCPLLVMSASTLVYVLYGIVSISFAIKDLDTLGVWLYLRSFLTYVFVSQFFFVVSLQFIFSVCCIHARLSSLAKNIK